MIAVTAFLALNALSFFVLAVDAKRNPYKWSHDVKDMNQNRHNKTPWDIDRHKAEQDAMAEDRQGCRALSDAVLQAALVALYPQKCQQDN